METIGSRTPNEVFRGEVVFLSRVPGKKDEHIINNNNGGKISILKEE